MLDMIIVKWRRVNVEELVWEDLQDIIVFLLMEKLMKYMIMVCAVSDLTFGSNLISKDSYQIFNSRIPCNSKRRVWHYAELWLGTS